jgi:hypothetical protein
MPIDEQLLTRMDYAFTESKRLLETLAAARRMAGNITSVVSEVAPIHLPGSKFLMSLAASCEEHIEGSLSDSLILSSFFAGVFSDGRPWIPVP